MLLGRVRRLERYGLAAELELGRWVIADRAEQTLKELGVRNNAIETMRRALAYHGLTEARGVVQYVCHGETGKETIVGRGLAGDEMSERVYLVVDGIDGRVHHMEFADPTRIEVGQGMIVEAAPAVSGPRPADRNIAIVAEEGEGVYRPSRHLERIRESFERQDEAPDAFVRFHVRRLEALRRAGHVERIDADHWRVPNNIVERGRAYDLARPSRAHALDVRPRTANRERRSDMARPRVRRRQTDSFD